MAHQSFPIRFRFINLALVWRVRNGLLCGRIPKKRADSYELSEIDGWALRDEFFSLPEGDLDALADFFAKAGAWPSSGAPNPNEPGHGMVYPVYVQPCDVWVFRSDLRDALLLKNRAGFKEQIAPRVSKAKTWLDLNTGSLANRFELRFELSDTAGGVVTITNVRHMLFATVLADVGRGIRFKTCRRKDCAKPFPIVSKHKKLFCSQYCGHLASQRAKRSQKRSAAKQKSS